jgi:hypothetical protein
MVALSLDHVPARLSKLQPHLHDHAIDTLLCKPDALPLDDNHAIDTLLSRSDALPPLDDNHAIYAIDAVLTTMLSKPYFETCAG